YRLRLVSPTPAAGARFQVTVNRVTVDRTGAWAYGRHAGTARPRCGPAGTCVVDTRGMPIGRIIMKGPGLIAAIIGAVLAVISLVEKLTHGAIPVIPSIWHGNLAIGVIGAILLVLGGYMIVRPPNQAKAS